MMKLFYSARSPFVRKCRIVAAEKGLADHIELVAAIPQDNPPELMAANPLGKIPALLLENGEVLCESPVICEYLDAIGQGAPLFPKGAERWDVLNRAALANGIMDVAVDRVHEGWRPDAQRDDALVVRYETSILRTLAELAKYIPAKDAALDIAMVNLGAALGYLDFRLPHLNWRAAHGALSEWFAVFSTRPSMQTTVPHV